MIVSPSPGNGHDGAGRRFAVRAVLFDFGGTLDADGVAWKDRLYRLWRQAQPAVAPARFDPAFYAADDALVGAIPASLGLGPTVERLVTGVARQLGADANGGAQRIAARFADDMRATLRRNATVLAALGRRYRLGVISNFYGNLEAICAETGIAELVATIVDSTCVGCTKPDPRLFRAALTALGVDAADTLVVGDSLPRDMAGARALGMPHVWLAEAGGVRRQPCCPGDPVIHSLPAIEALLS